MAQAGARNLGAAQLLRNIHGTVEASYQEPVQALIKGNSSVEKPAYLVKSVAANLALKLHKLPHLRGAKA